MKRAILVVVVLAILGLAAWAHWPQERLPAGTRADHVVVRKANRTLDLYRGAELLRSYRVALGSDPRGHKEQEGDGRTPEGRYRLDYRKANSAFHRALHVSYPSSSDTAAARQRGVSPGGLIMVHGIKNGLSFIGRLHTVIDWTDGCVAVTNAEMDEIWATVADGTPILIEP